jgi:hypothetical protein
MTRRLAGLATASVSGSYHERDRPVERHAADEAEMTGDGIANLAGPDHSIIGSAVLVDVNEPRNLAHRGESSRAPQIAHDDEPGHVQWERRPDRTSTRSTSAARAESSRYRRLR